MSKEHPPSECNSTPVRDNRKLTAAIEGIKEAFVAHNLLMRASIENEKLRNMYLCKLHHVVLVMCHVLVIISCILVYMFWA